MAAFEYNGSNIAANWVLTSVGQSGTTGFEDGGEDLAQKYSQCSNASCYVTQSPVCESIPSVFDPNQSITFWTGACAGGGGGGDPVE